MSLTDELRGKTFRFGRVDGTSIGMLTLSADGSLSGYQNANETSWSVEDGRLVFRGPNGQVTTIFNQVGRNGGALALCGEFLPRGHGPWHMLTEILGQPHSSVILELRAELYGGDGPLAHADARYVDDGYPHTNLMPDLVGSVLDSVQPRFWLEIGSMLGGSAIRTANVIKAKAFATEIVCIDPFTGDVNMWAWEQPKRLAHEWQFLRLERGRPTIYDRFLANVTAAGHTGTILPIAATALVGIKLLRRLVSERRLSSLPEVIYLDCAHEPDETLLELHHCWGLLEPGGVLMGDDWDWASIRNDVLRFVRTIRIDPDRRQRLAVRHGRFTEHEGILLDRGQWVLVK